MRRYSFRTSIGPLRSFPRRIRRALLGVDLVLVFGVLRPAHGVDVAAIVLILLQIFFRVVSSHGCAAVEAHRVLAIAGVWMCSAWSPFRAFLLALCQPRLASVMQNGHVSPYGTHAHSAPSRIAFFSVVSAPARFTRRLTPPCSCGDSVW